MRPSQTAINIVTAEGEYRLHDFKPFLTHAHHPDIRAYLDPGRFSAFRIEYGELVWGDYDLCFPIIDLYRNQLEHRARKEVAA